MGKKDHCAKNPGKFPPKFQFTWIWVIKACFIRQEVINSLNLLPAAYFRQPLLAFLSFPTGTYHVQYFASQFKARVSYK